MRGSRERGSGGSSGGWERTHENVEHTPHRHNTTQHNTTQTQTQQQQQQQQQQQIPHRKQDMSNQLFPNSSPTGQGFLGSRMVRKGLGTTPFDRKKQSGKLSGSKVVRAKKWWGPKVVRKTKNTKKNMKKNPSLLHPKQE